MSRPAAGTPVPEDKAPWLGRAFAFAVAAFLWWRLSENTADNDLWGHVLYGLRMLHRGGLETTETLSWTATGRPWINHEVLAEATLALSHRLAGGTGLWVLMVGLAALSIGWAWQEGAGAMPGQRRTALALLAVSGNFIALGCSARPQLFTLLAFVALLVALRRFFAGKTAWGLVPPLLLAAWVNTHGGYLAGWLVAILATLAEVGIRLLPALERPLRADPARLGLAELGVFATAISLALLLNPWGWQLVAWTVETLRLPRPEITEWQVMPLTVSTLPFYFTLIVGCAAWAVSTQPRRLWETPVWALLAAMAVLHQRHAPLFGLASLVLLPPHLHALLRRLAPATVRLRSTLAQPRLNTILSVVVLAGAVWCLRASLSAPRQYPFRMEVPRSLYPVAAIEYIRSSGLTGETITFFDWGQQVLWELPDNPVSFDGRLDTVYPFAVMAAHWRLYAGRDPGPALDLARARVALLPTGGGGAELLRRLGWTVCYADPLATVLSRSAAAGSIIRADGSILRGSSPFPDAEPVLARRAAATRP